LVEKRVNTRGQKIKNFNTEKEHLAKMIDIVSEEGENDKKRVLLKELLIEILEIHTQ